MTKMIITRRVVDVDNWLKGKSERADSISVLGGSNVTDHVAHDGTNSVAVSAEVDDVAKVMATLASPPPELAAAMERHGVLPPLTVYVEE